MIKLNIDILTHILTFFPEFLFSYKNKNVSHIPKIISKELYNFKCVSKLFRDAIELYLKKYKYESIDFFGFNFVKKYFVSCILEKYYCDRIELYSVTNFLLQFYNEKYYTTQVFPFNLKIYEDIIENATKMNNVNFILNFIETDDIFKNTQNLIVIMDSMNIIKNICNLNNIQFIRYLHEKNILQYSINIYFHYACFNGNIELLKELYCLKYYIHEYYFGIICLSNNLEMAEWFIANINVANIDNGIKKKIISNNQNRMIKFLKDNNLM
jgi:hypothetical protein